VKRWVFNPAPNCPRLMDDERSCDGSAFQTAGAATWKLRRPSCVHVEGDKHVAAFCRTKICVTRNAAGPFVTCNGVDGDHFCVAPHSFFFFIQIFRTVFPAVLIVLY